MISTDIYEYMTAAELSAVINADTKAVESDIDSILSEFGF